MSGTIGMKMGMGMGSVFQGATEAPGKIDHSEGNHPPSGNASAGRLEPIQSGNSQSEGDANETEQDGTSDMTQTAKESDPGGFSHRPATGLSHNDEREVMVGTDNSMDKTERGGSGGEKGQFIGHRYHTQLVFYEENNNQLGKLSKYRGCEK